MMKFFFLFLFLYISISNGYSEPSSFIYITSQQGFDNLSRNIGNAIRQRVSNIEIIFEDGTYYYNDRNKVVIESNTSSRITFRAKHTGKLRIVSDGEDYSVSQSVDTVGKWYKVKLKAPLDKYCTFQTPDGKAIPLGDTGYLNDTLQTNISDAAIELVDSVKKVARIKLSPELSFLKNRKQSYFKYSQLCYKAQWSDCYRDILHSNNEYIYFTLTERLLKKWNSYVANMYQ